MTRPDGAVEGLLLDTHVLLWLASEPERCGAALEVVNDPGVDLWISAASTWELAIKCSLGRLDLPSPPAVYVEECRHRLAALLVGVDHRHAGAVATLPWHHRDPFDRLLLAQAREMGLALATADRRLEVYEVPILVVG